MELLKKIRKRINDHLLGLNNVNRLMTDKVNDYILIEEQPIPIRIGAKTIYIGNFPLDQNADFFEGWLKILALMGSKNLNFDMLSEGAELYKVIMTHRKIYKELVKLIGKTICKSQQLYIEENKYGAETKKTLKWVNCSYGYFKKHITMEKLLQICYLVYIYNYDSEKKNFQILLPRITRGQNKPMETYMSFWLQNLVGLTGEFQLALYPEPEYWANDSQKIELPLNQKALKKMAGN